MLLSYALIQNVSKNLNFNTTSFVFEEDKKYNDNLTKFISVLYDELVEDDNVRSKMLKKHKNNELTQNFVFDQDFVIMYIVTLTFSKSNIMVHISDVMGNVKWFCSSGSLKITGKQKKQKRSVVLKLILFLFKEANFILKKPVALHLNNVGSSQTFVINKLQKEIYIKIIKSFNQIPYNGCRKKKIRRKKYTKIFK